MTRDEETARIQEIVDKYRIGASEASTIWVLSSFVVWLAKNEYAICDTTDLIPTRQVLEELIPEFMKEKNDDD